MRESEKPDWLPYTPSQGENGSFNFGNWQAVRAAIKAAYGVLSRETSSDIPTCDWNLVGLALAFNQHSLIPNCAECSRPINSGVVIRCADCKCALHEGGCAERHLWPNGRNNPCPPLYVVKLEKRIAELEAEQKEQTGA